MDVPEKIPCQVRVNPLPNPVILQEIIQSARVQLQHLMQVQVSITMHGRMVQSPKQLQPEMQTHTL
jgi:hypothetical protein